MTCACSNCRNGGVKQKPPGCRCPGESHANINCFITKTPSPNIGDYLRTLGVPVDDDGVRAALRELVERRRLTPEPEAGTRTS